MRFRACTLSLCFLILLAIPAFAVEWPPISDADRSMTNITEQPGAAAVILLREETDDNMNNELTVFERIKVLTEAGRAYATVDFPSSRLFSIASLNGRTVHADGSITLFTGKPFEKTVAGADGTQSTTKAFTLSDVQVGSIVDFRYSIRFIDFRVFPPEWDVQSDLFQRKAYFKFIPMQNRGYASVRLAHGQLARQIAWTPFLGNGAQPEIHRLPEQTHPTVHDVLLWVDLNMNNVPALVQEPFMPPVSLLRWRVYFYYQVTLKPEDYWKDEGKFWNKDLERFLAKNNGIVAALAKIVSPVEPPEQRVHEIYSFVSGLKHESENTNAPKQKAYALEYRAPECIMESGITGLAASGVSGCVESQSSNIDEKSHNRGAGDVLEHGGGTHNDLNRLFVALVRAAGLPASLIWVPDRSEQAFIKEYLSTDQLDGEIAIIQLGGKDVFLDPGTKFCPYGMIDWRYSSEMGLRQNERGAEIGETPALDYKQSLMTRKANLALGRDGVLSGVVSLYYKGIAAILLRQRGASVDGEGQKNVLAQQLTGLLRGQKDTHLVNSPDWNGTETPLVAQFQVRIALPRPADKQLSIAEHLFQAGEPPRFPLVQRTNAIDFRFPWQEADEIRITLPEGMKVQTLTADDSISLPNARYRVEHKVESTSIIYSRRDFIMAAGLMMPEKYPDVKDFFDRIQVDDDGVAVMEPLSSVATTN